MAVAALPLPQQGRVRYEIAGAGKECYTHYTVYGDLKAGHRPLIALHGGPGATAAYLEPLAALVTTIRHPVILYDQVGCGASTRLPEKKGDTAFWTVDLFIGELANLVAHLGLSSYDLFGNSWGGMLAAEVALTNPPGLHKIIIADSPASMATWSAETKNLVAALPANARETIARLEAAGAIEDPAYEEAVNVFYERHLCRTKPWPRGVLTMFDNLREDSTVYHTMNGPSEFTVLGSLRNWDITSRLPDITHPVLLLNGAYDEATDVCVAPYFHHLPRVKWFTFADSAHMPHYDEPERFLKVVGDFVS